MPKCPPFRYFKQKKHVLSRSLLVYKYIIRYCRSLKVGLYIARRFYFTENRLRNEKSRITVTENITL